MYLGIYADFEGIVGYSFEYSENDGYSIKTLLDLTNPSEIELNAWLKATFPRFYNHKSILEGTWSNKNEFLKGVFYKSDVGGSIEQTILRAEAIAENDITLDDAFLCVNALLNDKRIKIGSDFKEKLEFALDTYDHPIRNHLVWALFYGIGVFHIIKLNKARYSNCFGHTSYAMYG